MRVESAEPHKTISSVMTESESCCETIQMTRFMTATVGCISWFLQLTASVLSNAHGNPTVSGMKTSTFAPVSAKYPIV